MLLTLVEMARPTKRDQPILISREEIDYIKRLLLSNGASFAWAVEEVVAEMDVPRDCLLHHLIELS